MSRARVELATYKSGMHKVVASQTWKKGAGEAARDALEEAQLLTDLVQQRALIESQIEVTVQELRAIGASWSVIGYALGITRAAAHKRYAGREFTSTRPSTNDESHAGTTVTPAIQSLEAWPHG